MRNANTNTYRVSSRGISIQYVFWEIASAMKMKNSKSSSLEQIGDIQGFFDSHLLVIKTFLNILFPSMTETSETQVYPIRCAELVRF